MADSPAPTTAPPANAPPVPAPQTAAPAPQADSGGPGNAQFGMLAEGGFVAKLGAGLRLSAADLKSAEGVDLASLPQPLPGVRLTRAKWETQKKRLKVDASLAVPHLEAANVSIYVNDEGKATFEAKLQKRLQLAALNNPLVSLSLSEEGAFGGSVTIGPSNLTPKGLKSLTVTGGGTLTIQGGLFSGNVDATLAYANLGNGEVHFAVGEGGRITGTGKLKVTPPFLDEVGADLTLAEDGNLNGTVTVSMTEAKSPIPALSLTGGTLSVTYANGAVSGSLTEFRAAYRGLADVTASATIASGAFSGEGNLALTVPGLNTATGQIRVRSGAVSGTMTLASSAFPEALPVKSGSITATLSENGRIGFSGNVAVELGPAGTGQLAAAYSEAGELSLSATINLTVPGLQGAQVSVAYANGDDLGRGAGADRPVADPRAQRQCRRALSAGAAGRARPRSPTRPTTASSPARIRVTVAQTEAGALQLGGSGQVEAQIAPRLRGTLTATILPEGGVDVSGRIVVTEPLELFPESEIRQGAVQILPEHPALGDPRRGDPGPRRRSRRHRRRRVPQHRRRGLLHHRQRGSRPDLLDLRRAVHPRLHRGLCRLRRRARSRRGAGLAHRRDRGGGDGGALRRDLGGAGALLCRRRLVDRGHRNPRRGRAAEGRPQCLGRGRGPLGHGLGGDLGAWRVGLERRPRPRACRRIWPTASASPARPRSSSTPPTSTLRA